MDILRIAALGTAGVLLGITVKGAKPEFALLVTVGAGLCILAGTVGKMQYLLGMLAQMKSYLPVDSSYLNTLLKMLGITYVGQFSAGICKDAGYSSIAGPANIPDAIHKVIGFYPMQMTDRKSTRLNSSHVKRSRMPSSA